MLYPYKPDPKAYEHYYCNQAGHGLPVFVGGKTYRGRGFGNLLGSIGRSLIPLLKSGAKTVLKEGAQTGMQIARDVLSGENFRSSMKHRSKQAGKRLLNQAVSRVAGPPPGQPDFKRIKPSASTKPSQSRKKNKTRRRRKTVGDIFG
eukprot:TRINITY_DN24483_c1_g2_i1.p6 TRINITY_DN24483_c1_g2~~TRINITY_DN24483_c1_g2_i1.p6  ORF type:complete len:147 (+),score=11.99 TRINITY_DN24483_c1_g2_i1:1820-2260(+)